VRMGGKRSMSIVARSRTGWPGYVKIIKDKNNGRARCAIALMMDSSMNRLQSLQHAGNST